MKAIDKSGLEIILGCINRIVIVIFNGVIL